MDAFLVLVGQLFLIAIAQTVLEVFIDAKNHLTKLLSVAGYVGGLYLVLMFAVNNIMPEMRTIFNTGF